MEELQLTLTPSRVDQRNFGIMLNNWRVGQVINALVVDRMPSGNMLLTAGGREFVTSMDLPVQPGSRLQLEVQQVTPQLVLKLVPSPEKTSSPVSAAALLSNNAMLTVGGARSVIGRSDASVAALLSSLTSQPGLRTVASQSPVLTSILSALTNQALQPTSLSAGALAQAVAQSGLFNEANLLSGRSLAPTTNNKTQLMQLQRSITELIGGQGLRPDTRAALSSLSDLTNAALANLSQQQLISMPQENAGQRWAFSLPLEWGGAFTDLAMTIEREPPDESSQDERPSWRINLAIELPELGKLSALLTLIGSEVTVLFRSDSQQVRTAFEGSLSDLRDRMIVSDFRVKHLATAAFEHSLPQSDETSDRFEVTV